MNNYIIWILVLATLNIVFLAVIIAMAKRISYFTKKTDENSNSEDTSAAKTTESDKLELYQKEIERLYDRENKLCNSLSNALDKLAQATGSDSVEYVNGVVSQAMNIINDALQ